MKRKMLLLLTCCIIGIGMVMAQTSKVTGKVLSSEDGEAIIGATIMVKGTTPSSCPVKNRSGMVFFP